MTVIEERDGGIRVRFALPGGESAEWSAVAPVWTSRSDAPAPAAERRAYDVVEADAEGVTGTCAVAAGAARLVVVDRWTTSAVDVVLERSVRVDGDEPGVGFATGSGLAAATEGWAPWVPFAPGAVYGDTGPVGDAFLGGPAVRARGAPAILVREDRLSAPVFALIGRERPGIAVWDDAPDAATVLADAADRVGAPLVDGGIRVLSLGAELVGDTVAVGAWSPAREGDVTYDAGGLPLGQHEGWRERFAPLVDGFEACWRVGFHVVAASDWDDAVSETWDAAWRRARPRVEPVPETAYLASTIDVLVGQVRHDPSGRAGIGLESDPTTARPVAGADAAVMGFVGANTDAALALLVAADGSSRGDRLREAACSILDAFATVPMDPPAGEGFDLRTGEPTCYRTLEGVPAVFARALAEGLHAALAASLLVGERGDAWRAWALRGGGWLLAQQREDGTFPRAWEAGTGRVLQDSPTATALTVPFLHALSEAGVEAAAAAALAAGEAAWRRTESGLGYAGATLDNPDVVDKEAAVFALESALVLARATGDLIWMDRAVVAARHAETWIHLWTPPMPRDAADDALHWKRGRTAVGMQGITTGVTMTDGFLAVDAAAFTTLAALTGDPHWRDVARLVFHGSKAMLATTTDAIDLAGPGWQQEHWNLGPTRGFGLNRHWLPWTAVATIRGHQRLMATGDPAAISIARGTAGSRAPSAGVRARSYAQRVTPSVS